MDFTALDDPFEKRRPISAMQWLAARAVCEGAPPTRGRIAAILGCDDSAVYAHAGAEGWRRLDFRSSKVRAAYGAFIETAASENGEAPDGSWAGPFATFAMPATEMPGSTTAELATGAEAQGPGEAAEGGHGDGAAHGGSGSPGASDDPLELLARAARTLAGRLADLLSRAEAGGRLNKTEIDGLLALARMTERWETLAKERATKEETQSDEEIARTLRKIDQRIVTLARAEAERLVAARDRAEESAAGSA